MSMQLVVLGSMFFGYRGLEIVLVRREEKNMMDGLQRVGDSDCDQGGGYD